MMTWVVLAAVVLALVLAVRQMARDHRKGRSLSCGSCRTCPFKGSCHNGAPAEPSSPSTSPAEALVKSPAEATTEAPIPPFPSPSGKGNPASGC